MITLCALLIGLIAMAIVSALVLLVGGAGFLVVFGDLIVCGLILWGIIKLFTRKKK